MGQMKIEISQGVGKKKTTVSERTLDLLIVKHRMARPTVQQQACET